MAGASRFYETDPGDPESPRLLNEYTGLHGTIRTGDSVTYENPEIPLFTDPDGPLTVSEIIDLHEGPPQVILNNGRYEVSALNLRKA